MSRLDEIEAIKQLKYKYFRCLDSKKWDEMATCFTEDASCAYDSGKYSYDGREAIMKFLREALGSHDIISLHQGHHPEIDVTGPAAATGIWYLEDRILFGGQKMMLWGAAFYRDGYVKIDGEWRIKTTGYDRTFEEIQSRELNLTSSGNHLKA
jgi:hypothetical protein